MRKLPLVLAGLFASYNCFAELGQISVKSYLEQPLYATIPIYNVADGNYANLSINLATADKFKNYGVDYNSDLGALQFKIINQGTSHYLQITSSRSISAPVLNLLLHYQENNNDFYRQYTILLNPIQYGANGYASKTTVNQAGGRNNAIPVGKYAANSNVKAAKVTKNTNRKYTGVYAQSFVNPFVKAHLAQFNANDMTFTMKAGDTLYIPARFVQLMYPRAGFPINQVIMAMGLANYHDLRDQNYIYESGETINLPEPAKIAAIPVALADEYVWKSTNSTEDRITLLSQLAKKYDNSIEISGDPTLFNQNGTARPNKAIKVNASGMVVKAISSAPVNASGVAKKLPITQPMQYEEPSILDQVLDFKLEIAGGLVVFAGLGLLLKRRKPKVQDDNDKPTKKDKKKKSKLDNSLSELHGESVQLQAPKKIAEQVQENKLAAAVTNETQSFGNKPQKATSDVFKPLNISSSAKAVDAADTLLEFNNAATKPASRVETFGYEFNRATTVDPEILSPKSEQILSDTTFGIKQSVEFIEPEVQQTAPTISLSESFAAVSSDQPTPVASIEVAPVATHADEVIHDDVIDTLEQILSIDKSRNDIRLKLFELYLAHGANARAGRYYEELDSMLEFDDPLRTNISHIASKYDFKTHAVSDTISFAEPTVQHNDVIAVPIDSVVHVHEEEITPDNLMEFAKTGTVEENDSLDFTPVSHSIEPAPAFVDISPAPAAVEVAAPTPVVNTIENMPISINPTHGRFEHPAGFVAEKLDKDVTETLEQILSFDETRNDIRLKLFEMYSAADMYVPACKYFVELDEILDSDDPLRATLAELVYKFGFQEGSDLAESTHVTEVSSHHTSQADDHELQFSSASSLLMQNQLDDAHLVDDNYADENVIAFNAVPSVAEISLESFNETKEVEPQPAATPAMTTEQQINLANMYCQINEQAKALELLKEVINSPVASFEHKDAAMKLILEHKLHG